MPEPRKKLPPAPKRMLVFVLAALIIAAALIWIFAGREAAPPVTEHDFELGHIEWSIDGYPAKVLKENTFTLDITGADGKPVTGASLAVKLDMLAMLCGDVDFRLAEISPGKYTGAGIPLMAGTWKATLTLETNGQTYKIERLLQAAY